MFLHVCKRLSLKVFDKNNSCRFAWINKFEFTRVENNNIIVRFNLLNYFVRWTYNLLHCIHEIILIHYSVKIRNFNSRSIRKKLIGVNKLFGCWNCIFLGYWFFGKKQSKYEILSTINNNFYFPIFTWTDLMNIYYGHPFAI